MSISKVLSSPTLSDNEVILEIERIASSGADLRAISDQIVIPSLEINAETPALTLKLALLKIELNCFARSKWIESLFSQISKAVLPRGLSAFTSSDTAVLYIKIKYEDLYSDYQFLAVKDADSIAADLAAGGSENISSQASHPKFMDLINKKLTLLNNIPERTYSTKGSICLLVASIYRKVIDLLLLTGNDFLKRNLLHHLNEKLRITGNSNSLAAGSPNSSALIENFNGIFTPLSCSFFKTTIEGRLVAFNQFHQFVTSYDSGLYVRQIASLFLSALLENHYENNVYNLSKYYDNISLHKIGNLLQPSSGHSDFNFEELISKMISNDKLPPGTTLDQLEQTLHFPVQESYHRMQDICDIIEEVTNLIEICEVR
ncbi:hypothetical protein CLIB1423_40S00232 [[Candida] railenensis]|uniref:PCI domain-containing protein n=1 Tax=[Candida] railenensis TaxID=45579 RepID=A0A9P0W1T9_9ASCO|nr:hypothetical protein CLIB1423_40S00232 [[Candida] railenensis]